MTCSPTCHRPASISSAMALKPGPAVLVGEGVAGPHLLDIAGGMKAVAVLETPAEPLAQRSATVLLPEPDTPITINAQGASTARHEFPPEARPGRPARRSRHSSARGTAGRVLAIEQARQDRLLVVPRYLEQHFAAGRQRGQGQRDPRHEGGDIGLGDADHPARGLLDRGVAGEERGGVAVGPAPIRTMSNSGRAGSRLFGAVERLQLARIGVGAPLRGLSAVVGIG